ncbi:hypothetical protein [Jiella sp. M17.18]
MAAVSTGFVARPARIGPDFADFRRDIVEAPREIVCFVRSMDSTLADLA